MTAAIMLRASSSVSDDQYKSLDRFGSLDSSDTFLSCATHPFPSQGSLAGLEELAAVGSMAANGSMPAVNIPSFNTNANNYGYIVNPFDPTRRRIRGECVTPKGTLTPSPQGSPQSRKMVRIGGRSASSDVELANNADFESDFSASNRDAYHEEIAPKHRSSHRTRVYQQANNGNKPRPRFELDHNEAASEAAATALSNKADDDTSEAGKRRPSYMPTRGLAAVLNQGLASLGEKLGKGSNVSSTEALDMKVRKSSTAGSSSVTTQQSTHDNSATTQLNNTTANGRKKSILKKSEKKADPELENLLVSDAESANTTPAASRKQPLSIGDLPPTANHDQLKSLTGPKLRISNIKEAQHQPQSQQKMVNSVATSTKNNGSVASKEIQTSTISLLALAQAAAAQAAKQQASDNSKSNGQENQCSAENHVFKCPNDMCRHNKMSSALTTSKRKICLCGRTMVNQSLLHQSPNNS